MKIYKLNLILFIMLVLCSCEKKITETVNADSWKSVNTIPNDHYIINSKIIGDKLYYHTMKWMGILDLNTGIPNLWDNMIGFYPYSGSHISDNYLVGLSFDKKCISISKIDTEIRRILLKKNSQDTTNYSCYIYPAFLDSTFSTNCEIITSFKQPISSNGTNQFLFFFYEPSSEKYGIYSCLLDISYYKPYEWDNLLIYKKDRCIINKIDETYSYDIQDIYYYKGKYVFSLHGNKIMDGNGNISDLSIRFSFDDIFEYQDKLWAVSGSHIYNTPDGDNWTDTGHTISPCPTFFEINGTLCAIVNESLFEVDLTNVKVYRLDNSGMDNHRITSVNHNNKDVYVSTRGGLYTRPLSGFFKNKQLLTNSKSGSLHLDKK